MIWKKRWPVYIFRWQFCIGFSQTDTRMEHFFSSTFERFLKLSKKLKKMLTCLLQIQLRNQILSEDKHDSMKINIKNPIAFTKHISMNLRYFFRHWPTIRPSVLNLPHWKTNLLAGYTNKKIQEKKSRKKTK